MFSNAVIFSLVVLPELEFARLSPLEALNKPDNGRDLEDAG
jgi:hypothetical protein